MSSVHLVKKKVDNRIRALLENGVKTNHRSIYVVVGDRGRDQVMYLHYMLSKARVQAKPSILWCYKKELQGFSSNKRKRMKQIQSKIKNGLRQPDEHDPFELFVAGTDIRYCYYKETQSILGNTYGMCVLQDYEAVTPNLLARTVETVHGGGVVILLLKSMKSLKQLYTIAMDVHARYRTESHSDIVNRFNERFILSLGSSEHCLIVDDELNILPISAARRVTALEQTGDEQAVDSELAKLVGELQDTEPAHTLVKQAKTSDQARAVLTFIEAISEKTLRNTVSLTAARGRGKSAALGIAMASAVAYGYSNIFVTSPSPENLKTLFEFVFRTFSALGYQQHVDYDVVQSTNPDFNQAVVRVNIFKEHRQTIQYIQPEDAQVLGQAELLIIDEAAAIPLPLVKKLLGPYLVFMASTINGYEGTGRSLSLKLLKQIREQSVTAGTESRIAGRSLREIKLEEPIRYSLDDPVEKWLNNLLCLDATGSTRLIGGCPHPSECDLFYVNRDTLFSFHPVSEAFLQRMVSLYVASHYKNSPNDLQLMADAPAHQLFVLLAPVTEETTLPEPLVVIQVCLEGEISRESVISSLSRGKKADGDLIPWSISQQFQDNDFASLSGARIVRIAVHPDYSRMGYGARAMEQLVEYFQGKTSFSELNDEDAKISLAEQNMKLMDDAEFDTLQSETLKIRDASQMPPLLLSLAETRAPNLHWLGVSYGLTADLLKFWRRSGFAPVYLRQSQNELTGEHTCIMLRMLEKESHTHDSNWLSAFTADFKRRFATLCGYQFSEFSTSLSLSVLDSVDEYVHASGDSKQVDAPLSSKELAETYTPYDIKRLESYSNNMLDYHVILDLVPQLAKHYFNHRMRSVTATPIVSMNQAEAEDVDALVDEKQLQLSAIQRAILMGIGLQHKSVDALAVELKMPAQQILALFIRIVRKSVDFYTRVQVESMEREADSGDVVKRSNDGSNKREVRDANEWDAHEGDMEEEVEQEGRVQLEAMRAQQREMIDSLNLQQFEIGGEAREWDTLNQDQVLGAKSSRVVSVKNDKSTKLLKRSAVTVEDVAREGVKQVAAYEKSKKQKKKQRKQ